MSESMGTKNVRAQKFTAKVAKDTKFAKKKIESRVHRLEMNKLKGWTG